MKLHILGSGSIDTHFLSASYLIDNTILLDCPNGIVKQMKKFKIDLKAINTIYISHFHADHFFDLPFLLLDRGLNGKCKHKLTLIGQPELKDKLNALMQIAYPDVAELVIKNSNIEFITAHDQQTIQHKGYSWTFYSMDHHVLPVLGLKLLAGNKTAAFSFDTSYCENLSKLLDGVDIALIEMSSIETNPFHMGEDSIKKIIANFPSTRILTTHMGDASRKLAQSFTETAEDGKQIDI